MLGTVAAWCDSDEQSAKVAFEESVEEVIGFLTDLDKELLRSGRKSEP